MYTMSAYTGSASAAAGLAALAALAALVAALVATATRGGGMAGGGGMDPQARALRGGAAHSHVGYGATDGEAAVGELTRTLECQPLLLDDADELGL
jgi:hypothetical protein